jgi:hypothetical protein
MIKNTGIIEGEAAVALAPFDEDLRVEPYHRYLKSWEVAAMAEHYGRRSEETAELAARMPHWRGEAGGVDDEGRLYSVCQANPDGKWDWYEIGGRWDGAVPENAVVARDLAKKLTAKRIPFSLLTPDGRWLDQETLRIEGLGKFHVDQKPARQWRQEIRRALTQFPNHLAVAVDCHR